jgi:sulfate adenylyltransferase
MGMRTTFTLCKLICLITYNSARIRISYILTMSHTLTARERTDLGGLLSGILAPAQSFMGCADYTSVLQNCTLASGEVYTIPITLWVSEPREIGVKITLIGQDTTPIATLTVSECYEPDVVNEAIAIAGVDDSNHPYVAELRRRPCTGYYLSGELVSLQPAPTRPYERTPQQLAPLLACSDVRIGFQTRNPLHQSHVAIINWAYNQISSESKCVLVHPVTGETQPGDTDTDTRIRAYRAAIPDLPPNTILSFLPIAMRMAGPREAVWHARIRANYGCTHFIVGRDHAGPSARRQDGTSFFHPLAAQELATSLCTSFITIIPCPEMGYDGASRSYRLVGSLPKFEAKAISGTAVRAAVREGRDLPGWYTAPDVAAVLRGGGSVFTKPVRGKVVYIVGVPAAGKTALATTIVQIIRTQTAWPVTYLDGDHVRAHLSAGLGLSDADRSMNVRRIGYVAAEVAKHGGIAVVANIAPFKEDRAWNRAAVEAVGGDYIEAYVNPGVDVCRARDPKGLYARNAAGLLKGLTGVDGRFDEVTPDIEIVDVDLYTSAVRILKRAGLWEFNADYLNRRVRGVFTWMGKAHLDTVQQYLQGLMCGEWEVTKDRIRLPSEGISVDCKLTVLSSTPFKVGRHTIHETFGKDARFTVTSQHHPPSGHECPNIFFTGVRDPVDQYLSALFQDIAEPAYPYHLLKAANPDELERMPTEVILQNVMRYPNELRNTCSPDRILCGVRENWGVDLADGLSVQHKDGSVFVRFNTETMLQDVTKAVPGFFDAVDIGNTGKQAWYATTYERCRAEVESLRFSQRWLYYVKPSFYEDPYVNVPFDTEHTYIILPGPDAAAIAFELNGYFNGPCKILPNGIFMLGDGPVVLTMPGTRPITEAGNARTRPTKADDTGTTTGGKTETPAVEVK